ncbi:YsnF/AvaK domain-containing protein [Muricoccus radiodurans]|uniref:YsnF/AvaK domain-containing protein n=1 Tax=Muricoccus radiodurans TaxID=2231721 RepID=UPI003CFA1F08
MTRTVTAYFDTIDAAEQASFELAKRVGGVRAQVFDTRSGTTELNTLQLPANDLALLEEGVRRGGAAVVAKVPDDEFTLAADALEESGAVDLDAREAEWRAAGWRGYQGSTQTAAMGSTVAERLSGAGTASATATGRLEGEEVIPIVEEQIHVGKREVEHGRVRIRSYVVETPVSEAVTLRDEQVHVERRAVDLPLSAVEDAFRERTIEAVEHDEEAVVAKDVRVKEELVIRKDVTERTQTISDTVRRTEVEVEDTRSGAAGVSGSPLRPKGA